MKYTFLFPYCRRESLKSTLISFLHHYPDRKDYEVIIIEDIANSEEPVEHTKLLNIIEEFKNRINIIHCLDTLRSYNSAKKYNVGFKRSSGQFLILSNPETFHTVNVLAGLDEEFSKNPNNYMVCACRSVIFESQIINNYEDHKNYKPETVGHPTSWYQHSTLNNRMLHFCSSISRDNFIRVGGFDERYCEGIAYEDDSFLKRVQMNGINIVLRDDLEVFHIDHSRQYLKDNQNLYNKNRDLWVRQLNTRDFFEKFV